MSLHNTPCNTQCVDILPCVLLCTSAVSLGVSYFTSQPLRSPCLAVWSSPTLSGVSSVHQCVPERRMKRYIFFLEKIIRMIPYHLSIATSPKQREVWLTLDSWSPPFLQKCGPPFFRLCPKNGRKCLYTSHICGTCLSKCTFCTMLWVSFQFGLWQCRSSANNFMLLRDLPFSQKIPLQWHTYHINCHLSSL